MHLVPSQNYLSDFLYSPVDGHRIFDRKRYLDLINAALTATESANNIRLRAINPFGFEVFPDRLRFLNMMLRRFYIYLYSDQPVYDARRLEESFLREFQSQCATRDPEFAKSIAVMAARTGSHLLLRPLVHQWGPSDRLIVTEFRHSTTDPLTDYANYLLACVPGILESTLVEMQRFELRSMARTRIFQIFLILYSALGERCLAMLPLDSKLKMFLQSHKSSPQFYFDATVCDPPKSAELDALSSIREILHEIHSQLHTLSRVTASVQIDVTSFHGDISLTYSIPHEQYECFCKAIKDAYADYWNYPTC